MRAIILSDLHYHNWQDFSYLKNGVNSRLLEIDATIRQYIDAKPGHNNLIILGDVFHKRGIIDVICHNTFLNTIYYYLQKNPENKVWILVGNHDQALITEEVHALSTFQTDRIIVLDKPVIEGIDGSLCFFIPYTKDHTKIQELLGREAEVDFVFGHFAVKNAKLINTDFALDTGVDLTTIKTKAKLGICLGHYHTPQALACPSPAWYVGSPIHHTFNDEGQGKRALIVTEDTISSLMVESPRFKTLHITSSTGEIPHITRDYYRVVLYNGEQMSKELETALGNARGYKTVLTKTTIAEALTTTFNLSTHIKEYLKNNNIPNKTDIYKLLSGLINESE